MKIKFLFLASVIPLLFIACSKDDTGGGTPITITEKTTLNVAYGTDPLQKMDIYLPANRSVATTKVIILIHGGAWISGDKSEFNPAIIDSLKNRVPDYAIFNINYRLGALPTTNVFPTQELDVKAAVEFIFGNRASYLVSDKFVLMGASAGGHLALLQAYKYQSPVKIKAVVDFCGPTDMVAMYNDYAVNPPAQLGIVALMSGTPATNSALYTQSSPITTAYANAVNACPTIIFQGTADAIVNATTQSVALKDKLTAATVVNEYHPYIGLGHVDTWGTTTLTDAYNKIQVFLTTHVQ
ncbi:MAG: alpha/beta hydrolase [Ferruginibacter sp.]